MTQFADLLLALLEIETHRTYLIYYLTINVFLTFSGGLVQTQTTLNKGEVHQALFQLNKELGLTNDKKVLADLEKEILKDIEDNPDIYKRESNTKSLSPPICFPGSKDPRCPH